MSVCVTVGETFGKVFAWLLFMGEGRGIAKGAHFIDRALGREVTRAVPRCKAVRSTVALKRQDIYYTELQKRDRERRPLLNQKMWGRRRWKKKI